MVFSSPVFLFLFLPAVYVIYRLLPGTRSRNVFLALASLVFYSFGQLEYLPLFLLSVIINWASGLALLKLEKGRRAVLTAAVISNLSILAYFKYTDFAIFNFNQLFGSGKQIILSADCAAAEITNMDARLVTRFEQGMTVNLLPPCYETRVAILRRRLKQWKSKLLTNEVVDFLAKNITHNVRALEGALVRLATFASFCRRELTVADAREQLKDLLTPTRRHVATGGLTVEAIQERVAEEFNIRLADMNGRRRTAAVAHPRQVAMYLARKHTEFSLQEIGAAFGGRDHGTVLHAARSIESKLKEDPELGKQLERIMAALS